MAWETMRDRLTGELFEEVDYAAFKSNITTLQKRNANAFYGSLSLNTTSTTFIDADATNLSLDITTTGGRLLISFSAYYATSGGAYCATTFSINGVAVESGNILTQSASRDGKMLYIADVAEGTYTIRVQFKAISGGTASLGNYMHFVVVEI